jgi:hypothetical protein
VRKALGYRISRKTIPFEFSTAKYFENSLYFPYTPIDAKIPMINVDLIE